jgi:hypothetical protein
MGLVTLAPVLLIADVRMLSRERTRMRCAAIVVTALIGFLLALGAVASAQQTKHFLDARTGWVTGSA